MKGALSPTAVQLCTAHGHEPWFRAGKANAGSKARLSAHEIEAAALTAARSRFPNMDAALTPRDLVQQCIERVVIGNEKVQITFKTHNGETNAAIEVPWSSTRSMSSARIEGGFDSDAPAPSPQLVQAIVRAHSWVRLLTNGTHKTIESLGSIRQCAFQDRPKRHPHGISGAGYHRDNSGGSSTGDVELDGFQERRGSRMGRAAKRVSILGCIRTA